MIDDKLRRKGLRLEYFTLTYNIFEGLVSIISGIVAGSIALVGFGCDSFIESISGLILVWRLRQDFRDLADEAEAERRAVRFVAWSFFLLALYVAFEAVKKLWFEEMPDGSLPGMAITFLSMVVMPTLSWQKYKTGQAMGSKALVADSKETLACVCLSATLFIGLALNYFWGWWWADPAASLIIAIFLAREGKELLTD